MFKYLWILIIVFCFSCSVVIEPTMNWLDFSYSIDFSSASGDNLISKISNWCENNDNIKQVLRHDFFCAYPKEVLDSKEGNCTSLSVLRVALVYKELGIKGNVLIYNKKDNSESHAVAEIGNLVYDHLKEVFSSSDDWLKNHQDFNFVQRINFDDIQFNIDCHREKILN